MRIFARGFAAEAVSNDNGVIENVDFGLSDATS